jgi:xylulokinase
VDSSNGWYLAIDLGTGGAKVAAVLENGDVVAEQFAPLQTTISDDGEATQDVETWWAHIATCTQHICSSHIVSPQACRGIGITGQWGSTVPIDNFGDPTGPCMLWADDRAASLSREVVGGMVSVSGLSVRKAATWVRLTGGAPSTGGADPTGHALWIRANEPAQYAKTKTFLEPVDYIALRLTGRVVATPASMILSWLTDNRPNASLRYSDELLQLAQRDPEKLPPLISTGSTVGTLLDSVATQLGLPATTPVVAGIPDLHTAWLGSGAVNDFEGHIAISTTAWVSASVPFKRTDVLHSMAAIPSISPGSYLIANNHDTGGACLRWFRDQVLGNGSPADDTPTYDAITAMAATVAPGAGGVIFAPWLKGERSPVDDRFLRASFLNVSLQTTQAALARAVLEGVAYNARWLLEASEKFAKKRLSVLRILGGGAQSDLWCQIHADVIGRPIEQVESPLNTNVRGAALFAALSLGHCTLAEAGTRSKIATVFYPDSSAHATHEPLYKEFVLLAKAQKSMYRRLNKRK